MTSDRPTADLSLDLQPWLTEIDALKQQLDTASQEAITARESADRWRQLYTQEAQQRRRDLEEAQEAQGQLQGELAKLQGDREMPRDAGRFGDEVAALGPEELRDRLVAALAENDDLVRQVATLTADLEGERAEHAKTRSDLTAALGDTVEVFARTKAQLAQKAVLPPRLDIDL